jgi:hypothetical protein
MPSMSSRARLLSATAMACGTVSLGATGASAQCVTSGETVTCQGNTPGVSAAPAGNLAVDVRSGAFITQIPSDSASIAFDGNTGDKSLTMQSGSQLAGIFRSTGNAGSVTVNNTGYIPGVTVTGPGTAQVSNNAGGQIQGASIAGSSTQVDNRGTFNGALSLSGGAAGVYNAGALNGLTMTGTDRNTFVNAVGGRSNSATTITGDGRVGPRI